MSTDGKPRICVFCGSRSGARPEYATAAAALGRRLAERGHGLVTGGGRVGLMGVIANAALEAGGEVIGVIPEHLKERELGHAALSELIVVPDMHERKATMARLAGAFVAMPGGIGTLEELFEALTWGQLGLHAKPTGLYDVAGFWDGLLAMLAGMRREGFLLADGGLPLVAADPDALLDGLLAWRAGSGA